MKRELRRYPYDYLLLAGSGVVGLIIFWLVWPNTFLQRGILLALCGLYPVWGIWHHAHRHRSTRPAIIAEYFAVSALLASIVWVILDW